MDISNEKISELLKNPEIVGMIASLASGFTSGSKEPVSAHENADASEEKAVAIQSSTPSEFSEEQHESAAPEFFAASSGNSDKRIALLQAIKPYINDSKKDKVDSLVKAIGVAGVLSSYTGGMFGNLFGNISGKH